MRKLNISIDDVSPHPRSSTRVLDKCYRILESVPHAKFTLFVPTAYWRSVPAPPESLCEKPLFLHEHPDFCEAIRRLPDESFEVGFHGHHHGIPGKSNNDELKTLTVDQAAETFLKMRDEVERSDLTHKFKRILRPPAWRLSPDGFDVARAFFDVLAINSAETYAAIYSGKQFDHHWKSRTVFADAYPPILGIPDQWDSLEVVFHACEWDRNYLSDEMADNMISLFHTSSASGAFIGDLLGKV